MGLQSAVQSQCLAALAMLKGAIVKCPQAVWDAPRDKDKFWYKAHHALYWAHRYFQATSKNFVRWKGHRKPHGGVPISKQKLLEYLAFIERQVAERVPATDFEKPSGLHGLRFDKLEWAIANIRHIQQHTGELHERLGTREDIKLRWAEHAYRMNT